MLNEGLKKYGIDYQSYLLLKAGIKPVIRLTIGENLQKHFEKFCNDLNLFVSIKRFNEIYNQELKVPVFIAYISTSEILAEKAYYAEYNANRKELGRMLGYPKCCVDEYVNRLLNKNLDYMVDCLLKTEGLNSFYCNFLFNFDSKLNSEGEQILKNNREIFERYKIYFLIKHIPCNFNCKNSIKLGEITFKLLKDELPELTRKIEFVLKKPILYFDYFNWIIFDGIVDGNELLYKQILPIKSLFPADKLKIIKKCNMIRCLDNKIFVLKNERVVLNMNKEYGSRGVIINFV